MLYNIHYDICALIISMVTAVCILTTKDNARQENRMFLVIVLNGLVSAIFDIASAVADSYPAKVPFVLLWGFSFMYLLLHNCQA
ncbi:MAG: hypothetical protein IJ679_05905, partial [Lachnospiraceae bacterium]|nr:hypothetical protein [Lachnospiraceae bacterium]